MRDLKVEEMNEVNGGWVVPLIKVVIMVVAVASTSEIGEGDSGSDSLGSCNSDGTGG